MAQDQMVRGGKNHCSIWSCNLLPQGGTEVFRRFFLWKKKECAHGEIEVPSFGIQILSPLPLWPFRNHHTHIVDIFWRILQIFYVPLKTRKSEIFLPLKDPMEENTTTRYCPFKSKKDIFSCCKYNVMHAKWEETLHVKASPMYDKSIGGKKSAQVILLQRLNK
jgi:hypothetical protein